MTNLLGTTLRGKTIHLRHLPLAGSEQPWRALCGWASTSASAAPEDLPLPAPAEGGCPCGCMLP